MGWQDRDWAKWNEDERSRFFGGGGSPRNGGRGFGVGALAAVVAVVADGQEGQVGVDPTPEPGGRAEALREVGEDRPHQQRLDERRPEVEAQDRDTGQPEGEPAKTGIV